MSRYCEHIDSLGNNCAKTPVALNRCPAHVRHHPVEAGILAVLDDRTRSALLEMNEVGDDILLKTIIGSGTVAEGTKRRYRALWNLHRYLNELRKSRRPGESLPAEALL